MAEKVEDKNYKKRFMNGFRMLCNSKSPYTVWGDCMALFAITIANTSILPLSKEGLFKSVYDGREKEYMRIINNYDKKEQKLFPQMFVLLIEELYHRPSQDLLGSLFMELEISSKHAGQFFTPYSVCEAMANVLIERKQLGKTVHKEGYASIYDPIYGNTLTKPEPVLPEDINSIWFTPMWFSDVWTLRRLFHNQDILGRK